MTNEYYKETKKAIKEHAESVREFKNNADQTEIRDQGALNLTLFPTPIQQLIENIVTKGAGYMDGIQAPSYSHRFTSYDHLKRQLQENTFWTDEKFEKDYGKFVPSNLNAFQTQKHLLEMEERTDDPIKEKELKDLRIKCSNFTKYNITLEHYFKVGRDFGYPYDLARYELLVRLNQTDKKDAVKFFTILQDCKDEMDVMRAMGWRYWSQSLQNLLQEETK
jgi:hypothetical protein